MPPPSPWTPELDAALRRLWDDDYSAAQIAARLGMTRNAVTGRMHRLKLQLRGRAKPRPAPKAAPRPFVLFGPNMKGVRTAPRPESAAIRPAQRKPCSLMELQPGQCKWPIGDPRETDFHFCGGPALEERPYCVEHTRIAYGGGDE